jgi:hypothetical protein
MLLSYRMATRIATLKVKEMDCQGNVAIRPKRTPMLRMLQQTREAKTCLAAVRAKRVD